MSTLPNQVNVSPSWKQEVNQLVAAHRDRKTVLVAEPEAQPGTHHTASRRAAAAAARVAARYANVPSYSEILAGEARAAVRAAEAASKAALEAQAAAESVLAGLEAASQSEAGWELTPYPVEIAASVPSEIRVQPRGTTAGPGDVLSAGGEADGEGFAIRWEPDMPVRQPETETARATLGDVRADAMKENWREPAWPVRDAAGEEAIEVVEPAQPIHANLIEFPREIVATRKVRPRLAEGPHAATGGQLSIFEVDPSTISTEPAAAGIVDVTLTPSWAGPEWSGIELDAQPQHGLLKESPVDALREQELEASAALGRVRNLNLAPLNRRLMAAVVNSSLVMGAFLVAAMVAAVNVKELPAVREVEVGAALALAVIAALYYSLFYVLAQGTPGTRYAGVSLCTFDGRKPTRAQRCGRLLALLVSVVPVGLGVMWAIFDDDHLSWHDRLSQTYLRKS